MNKLKDVKAGNFEKIIDEGYSLDLLYLLSLADQKYDISSFQNPKIDSILRTCIRKELILDGNITLKGKELLGYLNEKIPKRLKKVEEELEEFDEFWLSYPVTDNFSYKGKIFKGSRSLRTNKEECKLKLKAILNEGKYTLKQIVEALDREILAKKEDSYISGDNKLKYMINSLSYLNQKRFENWLEKEELIVNNSVIDI